MFYRQLPWYMHTGMSAAEFWNGSPYLAVIYRQKHIYDIKRRNQELWLQGLYIYEAVSALFNNTFGKKGRRKLYYPEKPHPITPLTKEEKEAEAERERQKIIDYFIRFEAAWKKKDSEDSGDGY